MPGSVAILGCGAIGGLAGFYMAQAGEPVVFIDQNAEHVKAIREKGIKVNGVCVPIFSLLLWPFSSTGWSNEPCAKPK